GAPCSYPALHREAASLLDRGDAGMLEPAALTDGATSPGRLACRGRVPCRDVCFGGRVDGVFGADQVPAVERDVPGLRVVGHRVVAGLGLPIPGVDRGPVVD